MGNLCKSSTATKSSIQQRDQELTDADVQGLPAAARLVLR